MFVGAILRGDTDDRFLLMPVYLGGFHILLGVTFLAIKPHRKTWMSNTDGIIFTPFVVMFLLVNFTKYVYIVRAVIAPSVLTLTVVYVAYKYIKKHKD